MSKRKRCPTCKRLFAKKPERVRIRRPTSKRKRCAHCKRVRLRKFIEWHPGIFEWQCSDFGSCDKAIALLGPGKA